MKALIAVALLVAIGVAPERDPHQILMNKIEASVHLPNEAGPLAAYGRYYSYSAPGTVRAIYLLPSSAPDPDKGCEVMTEDFSSRPCTKQEIAETRKQFAEEAKRQLPAGNRRWIDDPKELPFIDDGGCTQITIDYDEARGRFIDIACNGDG